MRAAPPAVQPSDDSAGRAAAKPGASARAGAGSGTGPAPGTSSASGAGTPSSAAGTKPVGAVQAAVRLLRYLADADRPLGVNRIARETNLYPSTCYGILRTLVAEDLVSFDEETKTYRLGFGVLKLALPLLDESRSVVQVRPHLERIARLHHVSTALFVLKGERMVLTDFALSGADIQIHHRSGSRFPILFGSTGRWYALRSGKSVETLRQDYAQLRLERGQSFDDWYADCRRAHEAGVGVDRGWARAHVTTIAVPIFDAYGRPVLSITASDLKERFTDDRLAQVASALMEAARQVAGAARKDVSA